MLPSSRRAPLRAALVIGAAALPLTPACAADGPAGEPILVTGTLSSRELQQLDTPALGVAIDGEQIAAINAVNVEDVIRYAPNLLVRKRYIGDANATLSFRNMHTQQTPRALVTVDGFIISDFLGADFDTAPKWAVLAPSDVAQAEIIYGPTSARYSGNSLGGTLRLVTAPITAEAIHLGVQGFYQNYRYYQTDEDLTGFALNGQADFALDDAGGVSLAWRHFENQGQPQQWQTVNAGTRYADQAQVDDALGFPLRIAAQDSVVDSVEDQIRLRGNWDTGTVQLRMLAALLLDRETTDNPLSFLRDEAGRPSFVGIPGITQGESESAEMLLGLGLATVAAGWKLDLSASRFRLLDGETRTSDQADIVSGAIPDSGLLTTPEAHWTSLEAVAERGFGAHEVALGASYAGYTGRGRTGAVADWRRATDPELRNASGGETQLVGLWAQDAITLAPAWTATLGLRWEHWRAQDGFLQSGATRVDYAGRSDHAWSPKAALTLRPDDVTEITASAAWATRFPTVGELYQAGLIGFGPDVGQVDLGSFDPDLRPERGFDLQLTAARRFGDVRVTISGYRQAVDDTLFSQSLLIPSPADPGTTVQQTLITNIGEVETWGADLIVAAEDVLIPGLSLDANLSWIDATITDNPLDPALEGNRFPRVPRWRANASLRYQASPALNLAANLRHQSTPDRDIQNSASSRCDTYYCVSPFAFVDLKAQLNVGRFMVDLGVDNLLDEKAFVFHPYPGRTFVLGLRWTGGVL
ncbi:TonB-dependent receptor [Croceibacterium ferulae]|uniref:TonB-dependent receptor n=1 Tax=Croceibacterium ferulae TaxID=1854641 RepID=UPI000EAEEC8B|nr:TonB-dependent receptor [Croceibacterium ferulae]